MKIGAFAGCYVSYVLISLIVFSSLQVEKLGKDSLINCAKTSMSSKLIAGDGDFFAYLVYFDKVFF